MRFNLLPASPAWPFHSLIALTSDWRGLVVLRLLLQVPLHVLHHEVLPCQLVVVGKMVDKPVSNRATRGEQRWLYIFTDIFSFLVWYVWKTFENKNRGTILFLLATRHYYHTVLWSCACHYHTNFLLCVMPKQRQEQHQTHTHTRTKKR